MSPPPPGAPETQAGPLARILVHGLHTATLRPAECASEVDVSRFKDVVKIRIVDAEERIKETQTHLDFPLHLTERLHWEDRIHGATVKRQPDWESGVAPHVTHCQRALWGCRRVHRAGGAQKTAGQSACELRLQGLARGMLPGSILTSKLNLVPGVTDSFVNENTAPALLDVAGGGSQTSASVGITGRAVHTACWARPWGSDPTDWQGARDFTLQQIPRDAMLHFESL